MQNLQNQLLSAPLIQKNRNLSATYSVDCPVHRPRKHLQRSRSLKKWEYWTVCTTIHKFRPSTALRQSKSNLLTCGFLSGSLSVWKYFLYVSHPMPTFPVFWRGFFVLISSATKMTYICPLYCSGKEDQQAWWVSVAEVRGLFELYLSNNSFGG